jgi:hypothetical protein
MRKIYQVVQQRRKKRIAKSQQGDKRERQYAALVSQLLKEAAKLRVEMDELPPTLRAQILRIIESKEESIRVLN